MILPRSLRKGNVISTIDSQREANLTKILQIKQTGNNRIINLNRTFLAIARDVLFSHKNERSIFMAVLKKEIKKDFTVVHNKFLRDIKLSINARGLLMTMLSMSDNWNFSIKGLASILPDGERKIASTLKELEELGYLIRKRKYEKGKISDWEYIFSDEPMSFGTEKSHVENVEKSTVASHQNLHLQNVNEEKVDMQKSGAKEIPYKKISYDEKSIYRSFFYFLSANLRGWETSQNDFQNLENRLVL